MTNDRYNKVKQDSDKEESAEFINPRTDFGFKRIFYILEMLMSFLNEVVFAENQDSFIKGIRYLPVEHFGESESERKVIYDIRCKTDDEKEIVIEMQNAQPKNFANRLVVYSSHLIRNQIPAINRKKKKEEKTQSWHYDLNAMYIIAIVNFPMLKGSLSKDRVIDQIQLTSIKTKQTFSNKINFIIVDLSKFNKTEKELKTLQDFWLYTLKYAETLRECPKVITDKLLIYLYENILKINKLTPEEMKTYNESVLELEQFSLFTDHAKMEGIEIGEKKGIEKGIEIGEKRGIEIGEKKGIKIGEKKGIEIGEKKGIEIGEKKGIEIAYSQIVHNAANKGISVENISNITNLSVEQVRSILRK